MRQILACFVASAVSAQTSSQSAASKAALLSTRPEDEDLQTGHEPNRAPHQPHVLGCRRGHRAFDVQLHSLPSDAEQVAPELRGYGYIVVEELVAIVDPQTRKVEIVFPRWGGQK
jgi:hypothetical protein